MHSSRAFFVSGQAQQIRFLGFSFVVAAPFANDAGFMRAGSDGCCVVPDMLLGGLIRVRQGLCDACGRIGRQSLVDSSQ